jgi:hypothetical protein
MRACIEMESMQEASYRNNVCLDTISELQNVDEMKYLFRAHRCIAKFTFFVGDSKLIINRYRFMVS